jgi:hypothetical protein
MDPISLILIQFAISYIMGRLTQPNGPRTKDLAAGLGDYGVVRPLLFGSAVRMVGVVIAQAAIKETVHKKKPAFDYLFGIVGALLPPTKTYTYSDTLALLLADRTNDDPIEGLINLKAGGKTIFNSSQSAVVSETLDGQGRLIRRKYGPNRYCKSVTVYGGGFDQLPDPILESVIGEQPGYVGSALVVLEDFQLKDFGNAVPVPIEALVQVKTNESLASVCESICAAAGIDPVRDLSSTALNDAVVRGYSITGESKCWDALKPLLPAFGVDLAEVAGQLRFYSRSQIMRSTIPPDDMGAYVGGDSPAKKFEFMRETDVKLPREMALTFIDPARDYQTNTAASKRSHGSAESNVAVNIPLVLTADEGASAAALMHWDAWLGRSQVRFSLTDAWNGIEPGLAYAIPIAGEFVPYRITRTLRGANGIIEVEAVSDEAVTYTASVTGTSGEVTPPNSTLIIDTRVVPIDGPIVNDSHDEYGFYAAMAGTDPDWPGADIEASTDGLAFSLIAFGADSSVIGDVTGMLAAGTTTGLNDTLDTTSVLTVVVLHHGMELVGASDAELDALANLCFVGKDGLGEYLQFKTATKIGPVTWELTNLRRGRKGTDWAIGAHVAGEEFALLTDGGVFRVAASTTDSWGVPLTLRGVTTNQDEADADTVAFTNTGEGKRPYSPVAVAGNWDGSYNLTISCTARSRLNAGGLGIDDLNEVDVEITSGAGRSITGAGTSVAYSAANQTADGITPGDTINGRIRRTSDVNDGRWRNFSLIGPITKIAFETDTALARGMLLRRGVGRADEADAALALNSPVSAPVGMATETETARALSSGPYGAHVGWRVKINSSVDAASVNHCGIREAELRGSVGGADLTTGGTAFQGGPGSDFGNGVNAPWDGNSANIWARSDASGFGFFFGYLFASPTVIAELSLTGASVAASPVDFELQYSDDTTNGTDGTWTTAFTAWEPSWSADGAVRIWPQAPAAGQYKAHRLNVTASNDASFTLIQEMEMRATVGGGDQCNGGRAFGSQANVNEEPAKAFDNADGNNYDLHIPVTGYIAYGFASPVGVAQYTVRCNNTNSRTPKDWDFQGSNDGVTWTTLNSQTNQTWAVPETKAFTV